MGHRCRLGMVIAVAGTVAVLVARADDTPALTAATTDSTPTSPTASTTDTVIDSTTASTATTVTVVESGVCLDGAYIVQDGDTPAALAVKFDIPVEALDFANIGTPGYDSFVVGTRLVIPAAGASCLGSSIGDGAAIVIYMPPESTDAQIALVRAVIDDLGAPIDSSRTEFLPGGDAAVFLLYADAATDPTAIYGIAEEL